MFVLLVCVVCVCSHVCFECWLLFCVCFGVSVVDHLFLFCLCGWLVV